MTSTMTIAQEADAVASIRQSKACHVRAWRLKGIGISNWIIKRWNCPANQQPHTTTTLPHYTLLHSYLTPLFLTNTISSQVLFVDPLWNQDAKEEEDQFFFSKRESKTISDSLPFPSASQAIPLPEGAYSDWTQALDLSRSKHVPLTSVRPATFQQSTTTSKQTVKSTSTMEEVSLLLTNPSRGPQVKSLPTLQGNFRPLPVIDPRYYGLFYKQ
jgi:hypothetical protein